jgi:hypothetical protein
MYFEKHARLAYVEFDMCDSKIGVFTYVHISKLLIKILCLKNTFSGGYTGWLCFRPGAYIVHTQLILSFLIIAVLLFLIINQAKQRILCQLSLNMRILGSFFYHDICVRIDFWMV